MCLDTASARKTLQDLGLDRKILACIIDEAHCIAQWGGDFRPAYSRLRALRSFLPRNTAPVAAFSATLTPADLLEVEDTLGIHRANAFYIHRGNDRPNIRMEVLQIESSHDYLALNSLLDFDNILHPDDIPKTIIFGNTRAQVQEIWRYITDKFSDERDYLHSSVAYIHSLRSPASKSKAMKQFLLGQLRILVATEAVGMVSDSLFCLLSRNRNPKLNHYRVPIFQMSNG